MRYEIELNTWFGADVWAAEFDNQNDLLTWYKKMKHLIEDNASSRDYIYKSKVSVWNE